MSIAGKVAGVDQNLLKLAKESRSLLPALRERLAAERGKPDADAGQLAELRTAIRELERAVGRVRFQSHGEQTEAAPSASPLKKSVAHKYVTKFRDKKGEWVYQYISSAGRYIDSPDAPTDAHPRVPLFQRDQHVRISGKYVHRSGDVGQVDDDPSDPGSLLQVRFADGQAAHYHAHELTAHDSSVKQTPLRVIADASTSVDVLKRHRADARYYGKRDPAQAQQAKAKADKILTSLRALVAAHPDLLEMPWDKQLRNLADLIKEAPAPVAKPVAAKAPAPAAKPSTVGRSAAATFGHTTADKKKKKAPDDSGGQQMMFSRRASVASVLRKAKAGTIIAGHKYKTRKRGPDGAWVYTYDEPAAHQADMFGGPMPESHGALPTPNKVATKPRKPSEKPADDDDPIDVVCSRCNGSGEYSYNMMHGTVCFKCNGDGTVTSTKKKEREKEKRRAARDADYKERHNQQESNAARTNTLIGKLNEFYADRVERELGHVDPQAYGHHTIFWFKQDLKKLGIEDVQTGFHGDLDKYLDKLPEIKASKADRLGMFGSGIGHMPRTKSNALNWIIDRAETTELGLEPHVFDRNIPERMADDLRKYFKDSGQIEEAGAIFKLQLSEPHGGRVKTRLAFGMPPKAKKSRGAPRLILRKAESKKKGQKWVSAGRKDEKGNPVFHDQAGREAVRTSDGEGVLYSFTDDAGGSVYTKKVFKLIGADDDETTCQLCGKVNLKKTAILIDTESGEEFRYGSDCAARALGWTQSEVERKVEEESKQADFNDWSQRIAAHPLTAEIQALQAQVMTHRTPELNIHLDPEFSRYIRSDEHKALSARENELHTERNTAVRKEINREKNRKYQDGLARNMPQTWRKKLSGMPRAAMLDGILEKIAQARTKGNVGSFQAPAGCKARWVSNLRRNGDQIEVSDHDGWKVAGDLWLDRLSDDFRVPGPSAWGAVNAPIHNEVPATPPGPKIESTVGTSVSAPAFGGKVAKPKKRGPSGDGGGGQTMMFSLGRPRLTLRKAQQGEQRPGHKYLSRKRGADGNWVYTYPESDLASQSEAAINHGVYVAAVAALKAGGMLEVPTAYKIYQFTSPDKIKESGKHNEIMIHVNSSQGWVAITRPQVDRWAGKLGVPGPGTHLEAKSARSEAEYHARRADTSNKRTDPQAIAARALDAAHNDVGAALAALLPKIGTDEEFTKEEQALYEAFGMEMNDRELLMGVDVAYERAKELITGVRDPYVIAREAADKAQSDKDAVNAAAGIVNWISGLGFTADKEPVVRDAAEGMKARNVHDGVGAAIVSLMDQLRRQPARVEEFLADAKRLDARRAVLREKAAAVGVHIQPPPNTAVESFMRIVERDYEPRFPGLLAKLRGEAAPATPATMAPLGDTMARAAAQVASSQFARATAVVAAVKQLPNGMIFTIAKSPIVGDLAGKWEVMHLGDMPFLHRVGKDESAKNTKPASAFAGFVETFSAQQPAFRSAYVDPDAPAAPAAPALVVPTPARKPSAKAPTFGGHAPAGKTKKKPPTSGGGQTMMFSHGRPRLLLSKAHKYTSKHKGTDGSWVYEYDEAPWKHSVKRYTEVGHQLPPELYHGTPTGIGNASHLTVERHDDGKYTIHHVMPHVRGEDGFAAKTPVATRIDVSNARLMIGRTIDRDMKNHVGDLIGAHRSMVADAIHAGKVVPKEALADYPDLADEYRQRITKQPKRKGPFEGHAPKQEMMFSQAARGGSGRFALPGSADHLGAHRKEYHRRKEAGEIQGTRQDWRSHVTDGWAGKKETHKIELLRELRHLEADVRGLDEGPNLDAANKKLETLRLRLSRLGHKV